MTDIPPTAAATSARNSRASTDRMVCAGAGAGVDRCGPVISARRVPSPLVTTSSLWCNSSGGMRSCTVATPIDWLSGAIGVGTSLAGSGPGS